MHKDIQKRAERYESHALIDIKLNWWNPFSTVSAVLLDVSWQGFKIEFVEPLHSIKIGDKLSMIIPLAPFDILSPTKLKLDLYIKWFDPNAMRAGGVFIEANQEQAYILEKVISKISYKKIK